MIHANSITAYDATAETRHSLEGRILDLMSDRIARTDRQIQHALDWPEAIRPRVTSLIKGGRLLEVGETMCEWTHRTVRLTKLFL